MRYILADELHCYPPAPIEQELERLDITYVQLLERIAAVLGQKPALFFREVSPSLPSYWSVYIQDHYPESVRERLLESLKQPNEEGLRLWEALAPYVLKKGTTLAVETIVYERQNWVLTLLRNWSSLEGLLSIEALEASSVGPKRPMIGMVLEGERLLNRVQQLAVAAAQTDLRLQGESLPFGSVAVRLGFISEAQLQQALAIQQDIAVALDSPKRLGFYLLEANVLTPTQLREALTAQRGSGQPLGQVLVGAGALPQELLDTLLAIQRIERIERVSAEVT